MNIKMPINMNTYKHIARVLIMVMLFSLIAINPGSPIVQEVEAATLDSGRITATFSSDGSKLTIKGTGSVPGAIPENAFAANSSYLSITERSKLSNVKTIEITGNIYEVGRYAFTGCTGVTKLIFSNTAKPMNVKFGAFYTCSSLTAAGITFSNNITHIQAGAFNTGRTGDLLSTLKKLDSRWTKYTTTNPHGYIIYDTLTFTAIRNYDMAFSMLTEINKERTNKGAGALTMRTDLLEAAMIRAFEIALLFEHIRPNGEKFHTLINHNGLIGENIASGGSSVGAAMNKLKNNKSDEADITDRRFKSVGVGCAQVNGVYYWVQIFSQETTGSQATKQTNKTVSTAVDFPLGTNNIYINGRSRSLGFSIDAGGNTVVAVGETKTLNLKMNGVPFARSSGKWSSDDSNIAKVSSDGKLTGVKVGKTVIKAGSSQTNRASLTVGVYQRVRVAGNNRYGTSIAAADKLKSLQGKSKFDCMIIAYGDNFADALSATYLSAVKKAPIILVNKANESNVISYVRNNLASGGKLYLIGGTAVVSQNLENNLYSLRPVRLAGTNRYGTNLAILKEAGVTGQDVLICTAKNYADSLSASSVGKPIMLVDQKMSNDQLTFLKNNNTSGLYYLIGGTVAVPDSIGTQLRGIGGRAQRVAGSNRYSTSLEVAKKFFPGKRNTVVCVYALNYPDGLSGGAIAVQYNSPVLLVSAKSSTDAQTYTKSVGARQVVAVGGSGIIPDAVLDNVGGWV